MAVPWRLTTPDVVAARETVRDHDHDHHHAHDSLAPHGGRYADILDAIGHTPLVEIPRMSPNPNVRILAKLEMVNPTGSVKDRVAKYLVEDLEARGLLHEDSIILEPTSGNTGIALAMIGRRKGYRVALVMPDNVTNERRQMAALFGAEVIDSPGALGSTGRSRWPSTSSRRTSASSCRTSTATRRTRWPTTRRPAPEILADCPEIDVFVAGLGTSGTLMGVSRYMREHKPGVRIVAAEPLPGELVQGLRSLEEGFIPEILDPALLDTKYLVSNRDAIAALRDLVFKEGIFAGPSCGAVLVAAAREARRDDLGHDRRAAPRWRLEVPLGRHVLDEPRRDGGGARGRRQLVVSAAHPGPRRPTCRTAIRDAIVAHARAEYPKRGGRADHRRRAGGGRRPGRSATRRRATRPRRRCATRSTPTTCTG